MELRDRVALITGGGRRVGRALALALARRGACVAVHYHETEAGARQVADAIAAQRGRAETFRADLTREHAPRELIDNVVATFGRLDVLVNSAAIMTRTPFGDVSSDTWDRVIALNLRAPFLLSQAAASHLRSAPGGGAIVNIADLSAYGTWPA